MAMTEEERAAVDALIANLRRRLKGPIDAVERDRALREMVWATAHQAPYLWPGKTGEMIRSEWYRERWRWRPLAPIGTAWTGRTAARHYDGRP